MPPRAERRFADRHDAGRRLAAQLAHYRARDPVILGLPRGGVPVAAEVARALGAPLDVLVVRKLGAPINPEYGIGAVAEGGVCLVDRDAAAAVGAREDELAAIVAGATRELDRRLAAYRASRPRLALAGRCVILVDDGLATGVTARAAARAAREQRPAWLVLAVPIASEEGAERLRAEVDELIALETTSALGAIGLWYDDFAPTPDAAVTDLLAAAAGASAPSARAVRIPAGTAAPLDGDLAVPAGAAGLVLFAHGSGSSRRSPRNRQVATALQEAGLATLLFDLLTPVEADDRANVFDVELLATRLVAVTRWARGQPELRDLPVGYFGASTGAAAALLAAAELGDEVAAVVSRGGRPDLAAGRLGEVTAPTLLIVGGADEVVLALNEQARRRLRCPSELVVVPGATHLFEEPGALESVAGAAAAWFLRHRSAPAPPAAGAGHVPLG